MNVFICWSGQRSKLIAQKLHDWVGNVIQSAKPWMSEHDILAGARWNFELTAKLKDAKVGILCLVPENLQAPWIHFEAGALSKALGDVTFVCPYLVEVSAADIEGPLAQFQAKLADKDGTKALLEMINVAIGSPLTKEALDTAFDVWWPKLDAELKKIPPATGKKESHRDQRAILEEVLDLVRGLNRNPTTQLQLFADRVGFPITPVLAARISQGTSASYIRDVGYRLWTMFQNGQLKLPQHLIDAAPHSEITKGYLADLYCDGRLKEVLPNNSIYPPEAFPKKSVGPEEIGS